MFAGITSGRGYAHGEVGIAHIDIESVCVRAIDLMPLFIHFDCACVFYCVSAGGEIDSVKR